MAAAIQGAAREKLTSIAKLLRLEVTDTAEQATYVVGAAASALNVGSAMVGQKFGT